MGWRQTAIEGLTGRPASLTLCFLSTIRRWHLEEWSENEPEPDRIEAEYTAAQSMSTNREHRSARVGHPVTPMTIQVPSMFITIAPIWKDTPFVAQLEASVAGQEWKFTIGTSPARKPSNVTKLDLFKGSGDQGGWQNRTGTAATAKGLHMWHAETTCLAIDVPERRCASHCKLCHRDGDLEGREREGLFPTSGGVGDILECAVIRTWPGAPVGKGLWRRHWGG
ncbi:hypothetical protein QBC34DRAFT_62070 [Podospora aff. communis PSN243]|uniref:Uncharacterized protein n=1 Tax=Podospora aff. communis PSN243 TaxID=3040156 RepID=A0AAV9GSP6_9PEZI|nr:hypothetical protein QBC34DRAFT_62070 [Podospora aff. communis PSN243]